MKIKFQLQKIISFTVFKSISKEASNLFSVINFILKQEIQKISSLLKTTPFYYWIEYSIAFIISQINSTPQYYYLNLHNITKMYYINFVIQFIELISIISVFHLLYVECHLNWVINSL